MKKYKIVNKRRFRIFQALIILLLATLIIFLSFFISNKLSLGEEIKEVESIMVVEGDSLWDIANRLARNSNNNLDTRQVVYEIKTLNNLENSQIYPGDLLVIPDL